MILDFFKKPQGPTDYRNKSELSKKTYSKLGVVLLLSMLLIIAVQELLVVLAGRGTITIKSDFWLWVLTFIPIYAIGIPVAILCFRSMPVINQDKREWSAKQLLKALVICVPLMYGGSMIGTIISMILSMGQSQNSLIEYVYDSSPVKYLVIVFLGPLMEELLFRKQLIDRSQMFGEKTSILFSATCFALFHANLYQFFYAFALGVVFGYVYAKTHHIEYSFLLHVVFNTFGGVVAPLIVSKLDLKALYDLEQGFYRTGTLNMELLQSILPSFSIFVAYVCLLLVVSVIGIIVLRKEMKKENIRIIDNAEVNLESAFNNIGFIGFASLCFCMSVLNLM